jgi:outer membrane protein TolC
MKFTMNDVIQIAKEQSPDAILARNRFLSSYWQYRSFRANYLPSITLNATLPNYNRTISWDDNTQTIVEKNSITNYGQISLGQNIGLTGGNVSVYSNLQQINQLGSTSSKEYLTTPVSISFNQPLFAYNNMRWDRKIQPIQYDEAKRNYIQAIEQLTIKAIGQFFDLAQAQLGLRIARVNLSNSDTLYKIARGRYNIGTIAQNDLLQMELSYLNAKTSLTGAEITLEMQKSQLRSFLGYNEKMDFELILTDTIPSLSLEYQKVHDLAMQNSPDILTWQRQLLQASQSVAQANGQRRNINLFASYGKNHNQTSNLPSAYQSPFNDQQQVQIGIQMPIVDWGQGWGKVKMAQSNRELVDVQVKQAKLNFEQNIFLQVMQFNLQSEQLKIAAKADTIAQYRYDVTKQRFLIGKIDVLNLNDALKEKDNSKRGYIDALRSYWNYFYTLRQLTQYDFINEKPLLEDFGKLAQ